MSNSTDLMRDFEDAILLMIEQPEQSSKKITNLLNQHKDGNLPAELKKVLQENLGILIGNLDQASKVLHKQKLFLELAEADIDSMTLRDALAASCRQVYATYPDHAGLIRALGIFTTEVPIKHVKRRWEAFGYLNLYSWVWHSSYGLGSIMEMDPISDLIYTQFERRQPFNLAQCLTTLSILKVNSYCFQLLKGGLVGGSIQKSFRELEQSVMEDFFPSPDSTELVIQALLIPKYFDQKAYVNWHSGVLINTAKKEGQSREWNESRSLDELNVALEKVAAISVNDQDAAHLNRIITTEAGKANAKFVLAKSLSTLWSLSTNTKWLQALIPNLPDDAPAWKSVESFIENSGKLPAKLFPYWVQVCYTIKGGDWLIDTITELPLRYIIMAEKTLNTTNKTTDDLFAVALQKLKKGLASADVLVWLWNQKRDEAKSTFANSNIIFRVLGQTVKGDYLKAQKEFYKLLMENREFQIAMMDGGTDKGINNFVKSIKSTTILNKGEQQSLLVKIVRIFPDAQDIVAERNEVVARRPIPKLTSYRSYEDRRLELEDIINNRIPKNSAQIARARDYGDLRENAEFKAAKDEQRYLMARRDELERGLKEVIPTNFSDVCVFEMVIPGCQVELTYAGQKQETYCILGLWDSNPEKCILSFDTPLGRALLGKKVGEDIITPQQLKATISKIMELPPAIKHDIEVSIN